MNSTHTTTVQLDFAADSLTEMLESLAALTEAAPGLSFSLLAVAGPSGWPLLACTMPTSSLDAFMQAYEG